MNHRKEKIFFIKFVLSSTSSAGKTSLISRFVDDKWNERCKYTIGYDYFTKILDLDDKSFKLQIWDSTSQERLRTCFSGYYKGAAGIIVVYDITDIESFNSINSLLSEIEEKADKNAYKILVGNKCDLEEQRQVTYEQGKEFADTNGMKFLETSAKTNQNVQEVFLTLAKEIVSQL